MELADDKLGKQVLGSMTALQLEAGLAGGTRGMHEALQEMLGVMRRYVELEAQIQDVQHARWFQKQVGGRPLSFWSAFVVDFTWLDMWLG